MKPTGITQQITKETVTRYGHYAAGKLHILVHFMAEQMQKFSMMDFALLKLCLISFGLCLGASFSKFFRKFRFILLIGCIISGLYVIWRIFSDKD